MNLPDDQKWRIVRTLGALAEWKIFQGRTWVSDVPTSLKGDEALAWADQFIISRQAFKLSSRYTCFSDEHYNDAVYVFDGAKLETDREPQVQKSRFRINRTTWGSGTHFYSRYRFRIKLL